MDKLWYIHTHNIDDSQNNYAALKTGNKLLSFHLNKILEKANL